jgi:DNA-binding GntR family transcriptional regulator
MDSSHLIDDFHTRPKSQALFERVRARILEGHHAPGQWLKQADLENEYGASRSEVRAVLSSLAERGVVEYVKNRGFRVYERTAEEIGEISEMIVALEGAAAARIATNATADDIEHLRSLAEDFENLIRKGSLAELRIANYRFHGALIALSGNKLITRTVCNLRECCASGPENRYGTFDGLQTSNSEHHAIIAAISDHDATRLEALLRNHALHSTA